MGSEAYIQMKLIRPERLDALNRFVTKLKEAKLSESFPSDREWKQCVDEQMGSYFSDHTPEEMQEWSREWEATPVEQRLQDPSLHPHWDFGSFLDALNNGEFIILELQVGTDDARLSFEPLAYPYGGCSCLVALAEAFGQEVVGVDDGGGFAPYEKQPSWKPKAHRE